MSFVVGGIKTIDQERLLEIHSRIFFEEYDIPWFFQGFIKAGLVN
jgi:hypothetical protein